MALATPLHLNMQRMFAIGPEDSTYIFDMTGNVDESTLAVSASNHAIKLYDMQTLTFTSQLLGTFINTSASNISLQCCLNAHVD